MADKWSSNRLSVTDLHELEDFLQEIAKAIYNLQDNYLFAYDDFVDDMKTLRCTVEEDLQSWSRKLFLARYDTKHHDLLNDLDKDGMCKNCPLRDGFEE